MPNTGIPSRLFPITEGFPVVSKKQSISCSNDLVYLPGQKGQENWRIMLEKGVPYSSDQRNNLMEIGEQVGIPFEVRLFIAP